jgi:hypothetical protein
MGLELGDAIVAGTVGGRVDCGSALMADPKPRRGFVELGVKSGRVEQIVAFRSRDGG